ncbi:hypothetical protein [Pontibacter roseus]|uniref:hypothetical protein n=1 Tax=Pontibacter roseus TaxID=336989 RepID=UPI000379F34E|nr:hypothetical protein [Pontibacter roseus]
MKITGKEGGPVDRAIAKRWAARYRRAGRGAVNCHIFGRERILELLNQEGCMGVKIYYALNEQDEQQLLLVATDVDGNNMEDGLIMDKSSTCPPDCSGSGDLDND